MGRGQSIGVDKSWEETDFEEFGPSAELTAARVRAGVRDKRARSGPLAGEDVIPGLSHGSGF